MSETLQYQLRIYFDEERAMRVRADRRSHDLMPLNEILDRYHATLVCQLDAFEDYVACAEQRGAFDDPLYKWTKVIIQDQAMRARHGSSFAIRIGGSELYSKPLADALRNDLRPLVNGPLVERMSMHDTNPANNVPIPAKHREATS